MRYHEFYLSEIFRMKFVIKILEVQMTAARVMIVVGFLMALTTAGLSAKSVSHWPNEIASALENR